MAVGGLLALPGSASAAGPVSLTWGGDTTLGSRTGSRRRRAGRSSRTSRRAAGERRHGVELRGHVRAGRGVEVRRRAVELLRVPGTGRVTRGRCGGRASTWRTSRTTTRSTSGPRLRVDPAGPAPRGRDPTGAPGEMRVLKRNGTRIAFVGFASYRGARPFNDPARGAPHGARRGPARRHRRGLFHGGAEGADRTHMPHGASTRSARTAATCARSRGSRSAPAPTSCSAPGPHVLRGLELYRGA